tara:strand:- start:37 stop:462 length:426 start_codon:yes stop_codon:yes gene_type:complete
MKVSKDLKWVIPFVHFVEDMYPNVKKLTEIRTIRFSYKSRDRAYGLLEDLGNSKYKLSLRTHYQYIDFYPLSVTKKSFSKLDLLITLAHELAHLYEWEHTPEHRVLENEICTAFMFKLKQQGYKSEEYELDGSNIIERMIK